METADLDNILEEIKQLKRYHAGSYEDIHRRTRYYPYPSDNGDYYLHSDIEKIIKKYTKCLNSQ